MDVERWRLRIYAVGFLIADALYLAAHGAARGTVFWVLALGALAAIVYGTATGRGRWLRVGASIFIVLAVAVPVVETAFNKAESLALAVAEVPVWPQLLVTLVGSRVLTAECELEFAELWRNPGRGAAAVELQSTPAAVALGAFLTLVFYLTVPQLMPLEAGQPSAILVSAMQGGTFVHSTIVFLFFVILAVILDAIRLHVADRAVLAAFRRAVSAADLSAAIPHPRSIMVGKLAASGHTRAARILTQAIDMMAGERAASDPLTALSYDGFRDASRRFVRTLLPFLPMLGFLGTVIGLATAISELPHGISDATGRSFDVSASLAGLAIKFETTLLGLMASMISSLALNLLEKREAEFAAACLLAVDGALKSERKGPDA
jgi:hypothetical protein